MNQTLKIAHKLRVKTERLDEDPETVQGHIVTTLFLQSPWHDLNPYQAGATP